jgi:subtilisin family serine protease
MENLMNKKCLIFFIILTCQIIGIYDSFGSLIPENPYFIMSGKKVDLEITQNKFIIIKDIKEKTLSNSIRDELYTRNISAPCSNFINSEGNNFEIYETDSYTPDVVLENLNNIAGIKYAGFIYSIDKKEILIDDKFVCKFKDSVKEKEIDKFLKINNFKFSKKFEFSKNCYLLKITDWVNQNTVDACQTCYQNKNIDFAYPDFYLDLQPMYDPNDPYYSNQWHLNNTGQNGALAGIDIDAKEAWDKTKGDNDLIVAVIDNGIDKNHEDFGTDQILEGKIMIDSDDSGNPPTLLGDHGTSVSGVIAASMDNDIGLCGVAPNCKILPIKLLGGQSKITAHAESFVYAAQQGASIINNSWGITNDFDDILPLPDMDRVALDYAADVGRSGLGCLIFFAAGNDNEPLTPNEITTYKKCITVGAVTDQGKRASYSDYGQLLDISAPSGGGKTTGIWTTDITGDNGYNMGLIQPGYYSIGVGLDENSGDHVQYKLSVSFDGLNWGNTTEEQEPNEDPFNQKVNYITIPGQVTGVIDKGDNQFYGVHDIFSMQILTENEFYFKLEYSPVETNMLVGMAGFDGQNINFVFTGLAANGLLEYQIPAGDRDGNYTNSFSGTSSACPAATGVAALILSKYPNLTRHEVTWIMEASAKKVDQDEGDYDQTGKSIYYGWGMVNAKDALELASKSFQLKTYYIMTNVDEIKESKPFTLKALLGHPKGNSFWDSKEQKYYYVDFDILLGTQSVYKGNEETFKYFMDIGTFSTLFEMPFPNLPKGTMANLTFVMKVINITTNQFDEFSKTIKIDIE